LKTQFENLEPLHKERLRLVENQINLGKNFFSSDPYLLFLHDCMENLGNSGTMTSKRANRIRMKSRRAWKRLPENQWNSYVKQAKLFSFFPREFDLSLDPVMYSVENPNFRERYF
jgi:hypothetical protein